MELRVHLPETREHHRRLVMARRVKLGTANEIDLRSAQRYLDGSIGYHGRWLVMGSRKHAVATEAYRRGLPIVRDLPIEIQEQLAREAS